MKNRSEKGFTLIELVIVVAILGILMAIAIPSYTGVVRTARSAQARAFASQINTYVMGEGVTQAMATGVENYPGTAACVDIKAAAVGGGDAASADAWDAGTTDESVEGVGECLWKLAAQEAFTVKYVTNVVTKEVQDQPDVVTQIDYRVGWSDDAFVTNRFSIGTGKLLGATIVLE